MKPMEKVDRKPVKVLAIITQLNRGGIESRLMDILRNIDYTRVQIDIFTCNLLEGVYDQEAKKLGSKIYYNNKLTIKNMYKYIKYFRDFLLNHAEYKIIHAHQDAWCSVFCKGAYLAGVPVRIAHSRTAISSLTIKNMCKNIIKQPVKKYATHYFAVSDKAAVWLFGNKNYQKGKVEIWRNAIDCKKFQYNPTVRYEERKKYNFQDEQLIVIHVGNFTQPKNHSFLIEIFLALKQIEPQAHLVLVGGNSFDGNKLESINRQVIKAGLCNSVTFMGVRNDIERLLQLGDVFVFPSFFEGFPGAVLEAQAAGLPCVISDTITEDVCVLPTTHRIALNGSLQSWVNQIQKAKLLKRHNTYNELSSHGFDIHLLIEELEKFYEGVSI